VCDPSWVDQWGRDRVDDLVRLTDAAMPSEGLSRDELLACCWDDPGAVLAAGRSNGSDRSRPADGRDGATVVFDGTAGAAAAVVRRSGDRAVGFVKLLAVHPGARRLGHGLALLRAVEDWAWDEGASELHLAGSAPFYLWPGIDVRATAMQCLVEVAGYEQTGVAFDMSLPTTFRRPIPEVVDIRRVLDEGDVGSVDALVDREWPEWLAEQRRASEQGTCLAAFDRTTGAPVAFACHSVNRAGWFGPTATTTDHRHQGIGHALLSEVCRDLMVAGYADVEIAWIGPFGFYARAGGAMSRVFRTFRRQKP
jgi:GNAT superfamily N-acetyltransferase